MRTVDPATEDVLHSWWYDPLNKGQVDVWALVPMSIEVDGNTYKARFFQVWSHPIRPEGANSKPADYVNCREDDDNCAACVASKTDGRIGDSNKGDPKKAKSLVVMARLRSRYPNSKTWIDEPEVVVYRFSGAEKWSALDKIVKLADKTGQKRVYVEIEQKGTTFKKVGIAVPTFTVQELDQLFEQHKATIVEKISQLKAEKVLENTLKTLSNDEISARIKKCLEADSWDTDSMVDEPAAGDSTEKTSTPADAASAAAAKVDDLDI